MIIRLDDVEIECTIDEAVELLVRFQKRQASVPWQGQQYRLAFPSDNTASYKVTIGRYSPDVTGDSVHNTRRR